MRDREMEREGSVNEERCPVQVIHRPVSKKK